MSQLTFDELCLRGESVMKHYGVKGMRWGVRKDDAKGGSAGAGVGQVGALPPPRPMKPGGPSYSIDAEGRITIQKGYELQRVFQTGKGSDGSEGANYFSFTEKDKQLYVAMMGAGIDSRFKFIRNLASDKVSTQLAAEELKSPSRKEAFDILKKTIDETGPAKGVKQYNGNYNKKEAYEWYQEANTKLVLDRENPLRQAYFDNLRKSGYNILLDEMDSGFMSDLPIVVLDGKKSLRQMTISDLDGQDVRAAKAFVNSKGNSRVRSLESYQRETRKAAG